MPSTPFSIRISFLIARSALAAAASATTSARRRTAASSAVRSARRSSSEAERVNARRAFTAFAGAVASAAETRGSTRAMSLDAAPASPGSSSAITLTRFRGIRIEARGLDAANCAESKALRTSPDLDSHAAAISPGDTRLPSAAATNDA